MMMVQSFSNVNELSKLVHRRRKARKLTQKELASLAGTGVRFVFDLEAAKPTCQLEKVMDVLHALGFSLQLNPKPLPIPEPRTKSPLPAFKIPPSVKKISKKPIILNKVALSIKIYHPSLVAA